MTMWYRIVGCMIMLTLSLLVPPLTAEAQQPAQVRRIGILGPFLTPERERNREAFRQSLRDLGWVEGQNLLIESRYAEGGVEQLPILAAELVRFQVEVIVTVGGATPAAKDATDTIPIVMSARDYDPIALGYVTGLARPGGNITGVVEQRLELTAKQLELLKAAFPTLTRVAILWDDASADQLRAAEAAARSLGVQLQALELRHPPYEFAGAFAAATQGQAEALWVLASPIFGMRVQYEQIVDLAARSRLPTMFGISDGARAGGLMAYDVHGGELWRRVADYVDKILKGTKPANLPVEQPMKFEFVINLKTAKALGLTMPPHLLVLADEVLQ